MNLLTGNIRIFTLVVDKKLNIVSKKNSNIHTSNKIADKARNLGLNNSFGFYFTSNSGGSFFIWVNNYI